MESALPLIFFEIKAWELAHITHIHAIKVVPNKSESKILDLHIKPSLDLSEKEMEDFGIDKDAPAFGEVASQIHEFFKDCNLCFWEEDSHGALLHSLSKEGFMLSKDIAILEAQALYLKYNPWDLKSVYESMLYRQLGDVSNPQTAAEATSMVFERMIKLYNLSDKSIEEIEKETHS